MAKIYVGDLGTDGSPTELEEEFSRYGAVRDVWVARNPPGFAFVHMEDYRDAEEAARRLDGRRICGQRVRVEISHGRSRPKPRGFYGQGGPPRDMVVSSAFRRGRHSRSPRRRNRSWSRSRERRNRRRRYSRSSSFSGSCSRSRSPRRRSKSRRSRSRSPGRSASPRRRSQSGSPRRRSRHHHRSRSVSPHNKRHLRGRSRSQSPSQGRSPNGGGRSDKHDPRHHDADD